MKNQWFEHDKSKNTIPAAANINVIQMFSCFFMGSPLVQHTTGPLLVSAAPDHQGNTDMGLTWFGCDVLATSDSRMPQKNIDNRVYRRLR
jgi:hypothetical protein